MDGENNGKPGGFPPICTSDVILVCISDVPAE